MTREQKLQLLQELEEVDRFSHIDQIGFQQLEEDLTKYRCNCPGLFPDPVSMAEACKVLNKYNVGAYAYFFQDHGTDPEPLPPGVKSYTIDFDSY